jgi:hypothetical protein
LQASYIFNQEAPSLSNLGGAQTISYNQSVYDFVKGQSVLATVITGGNRGLVRESRNDIKLGINWTLPVVKNSNLIVEYFDNRSRNVSSSFPALTAAVLGAYPGRVTRDSLTGDITQIDETPSPSPASTKSACAGASTCSAMWASRCRRCAVAACSAMVLRRAVRRRARVARRRVKAADRVAVAAKVAAPAAVRVAAVPVHRVRPQAAVRARR